MGSEQTICSTDLELGLGFSHTRQISTSSNMIHAAVEVTSPAAVRLPSLNLSLSCETYDRNKDRESSDLYRQDSSASSYLSNATVKREREVCGVVFVRAEAAAGAAERVCSGAVMWENGEVGCKNNYATKNKKQRLSKSQSSLLEETFKQTTTLNSNKAKANRRRLRVVEEMLREVEG
ncbi:unnamed protein product [Cuscuta epithymum]|uniref:Uncharacterized protein n=1 Tax=Cuscuta epithymum TaxID=186058 RepID=A0AAV0DJZ7_9ASTE|nr:unnamed protein product [Cuscuta epithymum]CAH9143805.1 unnamed protein product [Cuscuta epithymum]